MKKTELEGTREKSFRFAIWAGGLTHLPTVKMVMDEMEISCYATATNYLSDWKRSLRKAKAEGKVMPY